MIIILNIKKGSANGWSLLSDLRLDLRALGSTEPIHSAAGEFHVIEGEFLSLSFGRLGAAEASPLPLVALCPVCACFFLREVAILLKINKPYN